MTVAWFAPSTPPALDDTAALIAELQSDHHIERFTAATAHDFVWKHFRAPYDLCVHELDNTSAHAFVWPYLLHYGGVLLLRARSLHDSRALALGRAQRLDDYIAEFTLDEGRRPRVRAVPPFARTGPWPMLRVPLTACRVAVVSQRHAPEILQDRYPDARIRFAPEGIGVPEVRNMQGPETRSAVVSFGALATDRIEPARRAMRHAEEGGTDARLEVDESPERLLREADVIVTLGWPPTAASRLLAIAAMAAGKPLVALETEASADWPALNPQTWRPRGAGSHAPIAVSIDVRDEEHSLVLSIRRLAADAQLRRTLGDAAQIWWRSHATPRHAADAWRPILQEAASLTTPPRPAGWPAHLDADGTANLHRILTEFGVSIDFDESTNLRSSI